MSALLIVNADDLGLDSNRDAGIFEAFSRGVVTQASLLVKGPTAARAARTAKKMGLPLGLHLDLTETAPAASPSEVASLLDEQGRKLGKHGLRDAIARGAVDLEHVSIEAQAQIDLFEVLTGSKPSHVDSHQHIHVELALAGTLAEVFARNGVRTTRIPDQSNTPLKSPFYRKVVASARQARAVYESRGIRSTAAFAGMESMSFEMHAEKLRETLLRHARQPSIELMCHPGYAGQGWDEFNQSPAREQELAVLAEQPFEPLVQRGLYRLSSFQDIERKPSCL
jgi:predicted glycoside hydrolase/deacetylase ChbG (UPF0249 family)